jgi:hypothetical protein
MSGVGGVLGYGPVHPMAHAPSTVASVRPPTGASSNRHPTGHEIGRRVPTGEQRLTHAPS